MKGILLILSLLSVSVYGQVTANIEASRTECFSPCTIIFSGIDTTGPEHIKFKDYGYFFDFDDDSLAVFDTTGLSKNSQFGGPLATHTFTCSESSINYSNGSCTYNVLLKVFPDETSESQDTVNVTVKAPSAAFSADNTVCVSTSGNFDGCPNGATTAKSVPGIGGYSGKRVMLRRGEVFGSVCIGYTENNVLVEPFGSSSYRPLISGSVDVGVDNSCNDKIPDNDSEIESYGDSWVSNVTVTGLRVGKVRFGMSYLDVGIHDIDMNYREEPAGGVVELASNTKFCEKTSSISCRNIPYPRGLYISETIVVGSAATPPSLNLKGYNCPMINWFGVVGSTVWNAVEHGLRIEGGQKIDVIHNIFRGHHSSNEKKHAITIRACGYLDIDMDEVTNRHEGDDNAPFSRYLVVADNILGSEDSTSASWKLQIAPTKSQEVETIVDAVVERNTFIDSLVSSSADLRIVGYYLTVRKDNIYSESNQDCTIGPQGANPLYGNMDCNGAVPHLGNTEYSCSR